MQTLGSGGCGCFNKVPKTSGDDHRMKLIINLTAATFVALLMQSKPSLQAVSSCLCKITRNLDRHSGRFGVETSTAEELTRALL